MKFKYTDYHIHTKWSIDIADNGPIFEDYIKKAEEYRINICFLEHYELYLIERDKFNPFYNNNIDNYLEELDTLKESYDFIYAGLEVDYYRDRETKLLEFMDDYEKELDFIAGTIHEWIPGYPITTRDSLILFLEKKPMKDVIDEYFKISKEMIESKIFKNVCHIDTIYRYINENDIIPEENCDISEETVLELGRLCIKNNIKIEYNLSGLRFPIKRPFPSRKITLELIKEGARFFVGSDSHSIEYFEKIIPEIKKSYEYLNLI
ncbi:MAG: PHP domain-containing protein [Candidatus Thorarchaeota archaeon]